MRTTLTIDEDVAVQLQRLRRSRNRGLKQIVNEALRRGLKQMSEEEKPYSNFRTRSVSLGRCLIGSIDDVSDALAIAEGENFR
ncbi:MAG: hypothetical protein JSV89_05505 [Spirochaetaceae bacterium]|nr:MAG: hypothetical protein JSV89_05505 [Spirochaetaceae bacterium]